MAALDVDALIKRFRDRAQAVKDRPLPPVAGDERKLFLAAKENDHLVLRIPLRPAAD